jgi:hypothetical protein
MNKGHVNGYIITFGCGQLNAGKFHRIKAPSSEVARAKAFDLFGEKWAFIYDSEEEAGVQKWGLKELTEKERVRQTYPAINLRVGGDYE